MGIAQTLGWLGSRSAESAPVVSSPTKVVLMRQERRIRSPWSLMGDDAMVARLIRGSFNPSLYLPTNGDVLVPLGDVGETCVCCADEKHHPSLWLDPELWGQTMNDFLKLSGRNVNLLVHDHVADSGHESILVTPISTDSASRSPLMYGLQPNSRLWIGSPDTSACDLGYLNPERVVASALEDLAVLVGRTLSY